MRVPGSNLLATALSVIGSQSPTWFQYQGEATNARGLVTSSYAAGVVIKRGSIQAVPRDRYESYGLDWAKSYVQWYVPNFQALPITRNPNGNGDVIEWNGRRYQCVGDTPWFAQDGWTGVLCIDIGPATGATTNA